MHPALRLSAALLIVISAAACGHKKKAVPPTADWEATAPKAGEVKVNIDAPAEYSEPTVYEQGIGLRAKASLARVVVSLENKTSDDIAVAPRDFALIKGKDKARDLVVISPVTADLASFRPLLLKPRDHGVFVFRVLGVVNPQGMGVVYNNPRQGIRLFVLIE
ncbi:hypothetical protein BH09SUM1_BH09SUM1_29860 [soil metagenome]